MRSVRQRAAMLPYGIYCETIILVTKRLLLYNDKQFNFMNIQ